MSAPAIKPIAQRTASSAPLVGENRAVERASGTVRNLKLTSGPSGECITADARKPAPEFANALRMLAHPPLFRKRDSEAYKAAQTRIADIFGNGIEIDEHGDGYARKVSL